MCAPGINRPATNRYAQPRSTSPFSVVTWCVLADTRLFPRTTPVWAGRAGSGFARTRLVHLDCSQCSMVLESSSRLSPPSQGVHATGQHVARPAAHTRNSTSSARLPLKLTAKSPSPLDHRHCHLAGHWIIPASQANLRVQLVKSVITWWHDVVRGSRLAGVGGLSPCASRQRCDTHQRTISRSSSRRLRTWGKKTLRRPWSGSDPPRSAYESFPSTAPIRAFRYAELRAALRDKVGLAGATKLPLYTTDADGWRSLRSKVDVHGSEAQKWSRGEHYRMGTVGRHV